MAGDLRRSTRNFTKENFEEEITSLSTKNDKLVLDLQEARQHLKLVEKELDATREIRDQLVLALKAKLNKFQFIQEHEGYRNFTNELVDQKNEQIEELSKESKMLLDVFGNKSTENNE